MPFLFAATLFASASLLFMVQPMVGRMVLPLLGGSPAVWNACMVFFQALLLVGYLYADRVTNRLEPRHQWIVHFGVLLFALAAMAAAAAFGPNHSPIAVAEALAPQGESNPIFGVLGLLAVAVGVPFFVASTSAPLLQKWFAFTGHPSARDPYFLYAASNLGSLISLLGYPLLIEPNFGLYQQAWVWGGCFFGLVVLISICGRAAANPLGAPPRAEPVRRNPVASPPERPAPPVAGAPDIDGPAPALGRKLHWLMLSFVPSSLLLGVTFTMTTDIASIPLLWVIPLALYLVTFIVAFGRVPNWFRLVIGNLAPVMLLLLVFLIISGVNPGTGIVLILHLATFFAAALMCHYELAQDRPSPRHLTNFYLWISLGGVLGGTFNALLAPVLFPLAFEYQITLVLACAMVPLLDAGGGATAGEVRETAAERGPFDAFLGPVIDFFRHIASTIESHRAVRLGLDAAFPLLMGGFLGAMFWLANTPWFDGASDYVAGRFTSDDIQKATTAHTVRTIVIFAVPIMFCFFFVERPIRFALCVAAILGLSEYRDTRTSVIHTERSFFGILKVKDADNKRDLIHGTTLHGTQYTGGHYSDSFQALPMFSPWDPLVVASSLQLYDLKEQPLTYYHRTGPVGAMFRELDARPGGTTADFAMVGLGTGSVSCYAHPGQRLTFYEIDPSVIALVRPPKYFTYVSDAECRKAKLDFVVGDARLRLRNEAEGKGDRKYALLLVDAFSSDSIPVHLLTKEAVQLYAERLAEGGFFALHISNKFVKLEPVVAQIALDLNLSAFVWNDDRERRGSGKTASSWVVLAKDPKSLGGLVVPVGDMIHDYDNHFQLEQVIQAEFQLDAAKEKDLDRLAEKGEVGTALAAMVKKSGSKTRLVDAMVEMYGHGFHRPKALKGVRAWTDDYADVLQVIMIKEVQAIRRLFGIETPVSE